MKNFHPTGNCPVRDVLSRLGDKWSMLVLTTLSVNGTMRFSDIHKTIDDISQRMLTVTLRTWSRRPGAPQSIPRSAAPRGILPHGTGHNSDATYRGPCKLGGRKHGRDTDEPADCRAVNRRKDGVTA